MKQGTAELLLLTVIVSRSISYVLSKIGLNGMPPLELLSIRFFLTTVILLILFHKRLPHTLFVCSNLQRLTRRKRQSPIAANIRKFRKILDR